MQVAPSISADSLQRQRERLRDNAVGDRRRAEELDISGIQDLREADSAEIHAGEKRLEGKELSGESARLRRNGREQSLRGLNRLADSSQRYAESFVRQEKGLDELRSAFSELQTSGARKSDALKKIDSGLQTQQRQNELQTSALGSLNGTQTKQERLTQSKSQSGQVLQTNLSVQKEQLDLQSETVADFLLAGADFAQGSKIKTEGFSAMSQALNHRSQADLWGDAQSHQELQKNWSEADAVRHQESKNQLLFSSLIENMKSKTAQIKADFHQASAARGEQTAENLSSQAAQMRQLGQSLQGQARLLEQSGQQHLCHAQQLKSCPWTYCQGVALERQGLAEVAQARLLKSNATHMKAQAQMRAMEAVEAKVRAEQAREISEEKKIEARGSSVRSEILSERSHSHAQKSESAKSQAAKADAEAQRFDRLARTENALASRLHARGVNRVGEGMQTQKVALGEQNQAALDFSASVQEEKSLQSQTRGEANTISGSLNLGRSFLGRSKAIMAGLNSSLGTERVAQNEVATGIAEFQSGLNGSVTSTARARQAAQLLEQARGLELEGLRLQNRGQKMLLQARPKMANAAKLSAQSFEALKDAERQEARAEALLEEGNQKLSAAAILRVKAEAYETVAGAI